MPYKSDKQRRFFHYAEQAGKKGFTKKMVNEYDQSSKGMDLPEEVKNKAKLAALKSLAK